MEMQETIKTGQKLRRYNNGIWERMSFWHKAIDCEMENGKNLEEEIRGIKDYRKNLLVYNEDSGCYQGYINGEWKDVVDTTIANNAPLYIVKDGEINNDIGFTLISHTGYATQMGKENGCFYISLSVSEKDGNAIKIQTVKKIDLTQYNNFHFNIGTSSFCARGLENMSLSKEECYNKWEKIKKGETGAGKDIYKYVLKKSDEKDSLPILIHDDNHMDISNLNGKYHITIRFHAIFDNTEGVYVGGRVLKIYNMWFD